MNTNLNDVREQIMKIFRRRTFQTVESNVQRSRAGEVLGVFQELRVSQCDWNLGSKRES